MTNNKERPKHMKPKPEDPVARKAEVNRIFEASFKRNEEALRRLAKL